MATQVEPGGANVWPQRNRGYRDKVIGRRRRDVRYMYMRQRRTRRTRRGGGNPTDAQRRRGMVFDQLNPDSTDSDDDDEFLHSGPSLTAENLHGTPQPSPTRYIEGSTRKSRKDTKSKARAHSRKEGNPFADLEGGRRRRQTRRHSRNIWRRR